MNAPKPAETAVQLAVREFWTKRLAERGITVGWGLDKHGKFHAEFARDAEAAWVAASRWQIGQAQA